MPKRLCSIIRLATATTLAIMLIAGHSYAGVSGKISGAVFKAETNEPLIGATVRVLGTDIVTQTDADGEFFFMNLPGGKYDVAVTHIGCKSVTKSGVRVLVDLTTPVDFELETSPVDIGAQVIVQATAPIIQPDLTSSRIIFTADRLETLPNILSVQSVLMSYPGVIVDADNSIHVRGGRSGQISYYLDGFSVQDPFVADRGIHIMPFALEELSLTSGGYSAEYGEALSGVVSAVSREGGSVYRGGIRVYEGATHAYDVTTADWSNLKRVGNRALSFHVSGPIPFADTRGYTFQTSAELRSSAGSLPHNGRGSFTGMTKVTMQPTQKMKFKFSGSIERTNGDLYYHRDVNGRSYDFNLDGLPSFERESHLLGLTNTYVFTERTILTTSLSQFSARIKSAPESLMDVHWSQWPGYSEDANGVYNGTIHDDNYLSSIDWTDPYQVVGYTVGDDFDPTFRERKSKYNSFRSTLLSQLNKTNQLKAGIEYRQYDVDWDFKQFYNEQPYGEQYSSSPKYASAFIQDKMEYNDFVMNLGIRFDYRTADIEYNSTPTESEITWKKAESKSRFSPRLGVSFPISEKSVMHFNYGIYHQVPRYTQLYTNLKGELNTGFPLLGNPDLEPEQTTSYELGLDHLIGDDLRLDVTAYYKDVKDLVTTSGYVLQQTQVTFYDNGDYGSVRGFDVGLEKLKMSGFFSGSVAYSFMMATGNGSYALEPYYTYLTSASDTLAPVGEYPLDFDQRHTISAVLDYRIPADFKGSLLGVPIPNAWGLNVVGRYGSGLPYTATDANGNRFGERNEARLPAHYTVDLRLNKDFTMSDGGYRVRLFVEADNLLNKQNIIDVYSRTGQPDDDQYDPQTGGAVDQLELSRLDRLFDHDPLNYSTPRTIRTGLEISF